MNEHYLRQARWAAERFGVTQGIQFKRMQVYELCRLEQAFDLVLFLGVFYHLRYPLLGLDVVSRRVGRMMAFQTLTMPGEEVAPRIDDLAFDERAALAAPGWPRMAFIEQRLANDPTNWWAPNHASGAGPVAFLRHAGHGATGQGDLPVRARSGTHVAHQRLGRGGIRRCDRAAARDGHAALNKPANSRKM